MQAALAALDLVPGGPATVAVAGVAACCWCSRSPAGPKPQDLVAPNGEHAADAIAALAKVPDALAGVYTYDGSTGAFTLAHSETGVPYDQTEKETIKAEATLWLKAKRCANWRNLCCRELEHAEAENARVCVTGSCRILSLPSIRRHLRPPASTLQAS